MDLKTMAKEDTQVGQNTSVRNALLDAFESVVFDSEETDNGNGGQEEEAPTVPSKGGDEQPDEHGLVYITRTFTVNPEEYQSVNYRPLNPPPVQKAAEETQTDEQIAEEDVVVGAEEKQTGDEAVVLDYATYIDGTSFLCFDSENGIDYSRIAMDAGNKTPVTRGNCETTFNQCRAENPLFCRYHGPKILEADIRTVIKARFGAGCVVSVTKDKDAKSPMTFRLTVGVRPEDKEKMEHVLYTFLHNNPGISTSDKMNPDNKGKFTQEFEMDLLRADKPPKRDDVKGQAAVRDRNRAEAQGKIMPVVKETKGMGKAVKTEAASKPVEEVTEQKSTEEVAAPIEEVATEGETIEEEKPMEEVPTPVPSKGGLERGTDEVGVSNAESTAEPATGAGEKTEIEETETWSEEDIAESAEKISAKTGFPTEAIKKGIKDSIEGGRDIEPSVMKVLEDNLPPDSPVIKGMKDRLEEDNTPLSDGESNTEEALKVAESAAKVNSSPRVKELANKVRESVGKAQKSKALVEELEGVKETKAKKSGKGLGALVVAAIDKAKDSAQAEVDEATATAAKNAKRIKAQSDRDYRASEKHVKGEAAAKVETALTDMAKKVFANSDKQTTVGEVADNISTAISDYAKLNGVEFEPDEEFTSTVAEIKTGSDKIDSLVSDFKGAVEGKSSTFHPEDISHLADSIAKTAKAVEANIGSLKDMEATAKRAIDNKVQVASAKARLTAESNTTLDGKSKQKIEEIYEDWVEEDVPEWVYALNEDEGKEYLSLLEEAMEHGGEDESDSLERLSKYEEEHQNAALKKQHREKEEQKEKLKESRKEQIEAARRLGLDAYKTDAELQRMLRVAKAHSSDPRQVQRAKDIETIMADRAEKKANTPKEDVDHKMVTDELTNDIEEIEEFNRQELVATILLRALEV